jgi:hypothetical protein
MGGLPQALKGSLAARKAAVDLMGWMVLMKQAIDRLPALADPVPGFVSKRALKPLRFGSYGLIFGREAIRGDTLPAAL